MSTVEDGVNIVGVQFMRAGKIYDYGYANQTLQVGDKVVVDTERGPAVADVVQIKFRPRSNYKDSSLKSITRLASDKDMGSSKDLQVEKVNRITKEKILELNLDMRVLKSEISLGGNKVIVYFTAPARVDFREMVKDLASKFRARVELKQVGARDEAKILGGIGICGREFCCSTFLREFVPVSIKMAKNQNLALNPAKLSGGCGRLRCCLTYEDETYKHLKKKMPGTGSIVLYDGDFRGQVLKTDLLNQSVLIEDEMGQSIERKIQDIEVIEKRKNRPSRPQNDRHDKKPREDSSSRNSSNRGRGPSEKTGRSDKQLDPQEKIALEKAKLAEERARVERNSKKAPISTTNLKPNNSTEDWGEDIDLDELMDDKE